MEQPALDKKLSDLISAGESELVEFKRAENGFSSDDLGKYVSALANEANLRGQDRAALQKACRINPGYSCQKSINSKGWFFLQACS